MKPMDQTLDTTEAFREEIQSDNVSNQKPQTATTDSSVQCQDSNIRTLFHAKIIDGKLIIPNLNTKNTSISVLSNGKEYREGSCELQIGDSVYIATKKYKHCTFYHFKVITLSPENNCILIFHTRVRNMRKIQLPRVDYSAFMRDFKRRHDL